MASQEESGELTQEEKSKRQLQWQNYAREVLDFVLGFRNAMITILAWIFISEISGYSVLNLLRSVISLFLYPFNLVLFSTPFDEIDVPEVFLILLPLVTLIVIGFLIIVSTED